MIDSPIASPLQLDPSVIKNESSSIHSLNVFQDQPLSQVDSSPLLSCPLMSDSNILDVHLSLNRKGNPEHKAED